MITVSYIIQHLLSIFALDKRFKVIFLISVFTLFVVLSFIKKDAYDIHLYTSSVGYVGYYEPAYEAVIAFIMTFENDPRTVILYFQLFLVVLCFGLSFFFSKKIASVIIIVLSVFFVLSLNNALRQGAASILLLYSLVFVLKDKRMLFILFSFLAFLFHFSSFFFALVTFSVFIYFLVIGKKISIPLNFCILFLISFVATLMLLSLLDYTGYSDYANLKLTGEGERTPLHIKIIPIMFVMIFSDLLVGQNIRIKEIKFLRLTRFFFAGFILNLAIIGGADEIGARLLFFYFAIELLLMLYLYESERVRSVVLILLSYTFAFNSWNVLNGLGSP